MTPERLEEIRALLDDPAAFEFGDLTGTATELLDEFDRLRAAAELMEKRLAERIAEGDRYYDEDEYANGAYSGEFEIAKKLLSYGRELGLFTEE